MKGFAAIRLDGREILHAENDLSIYEVDRYFRQFVVGNLPQNNRRGMMDLFFRGSHILDLTLGKFPLPASYAAEFQGVGGADLAVAGEIMRFRYRGSDTNLAPASPNQIGFAVGRVYASLTTSGPNPIGVLSMVEINLRQVGSVFGHPTGRRAFFNETAIVPTGVGVLTVAGPFTPSGPAEELHYMNDIRIKVSGNSTSAQYVWRRRPYFFGCYEAGAGAGDFVLAAGSDTPATRVGVLSGRATALWTSLFADATAPTPSTVPYNDNYPTTAAKTGSVTSSCPGICFDGLVNGRVWWCIVDQVDNANANASASRALWAWKRMTGEAPARQDLTLTSFPTLNAQVQFRDVKAGRGGYVYLAADGNNDAGAGGATGALIMINAATNAVTHVIGTAAAGIYTDGGFLENNVLGIAVDKSETQAGAGLDRVWVLHRNGLSFFDVTIATGAISARSTVANAGATFNTIAAGSIRGWGGFLYPDASLVTLNQHPSLIDVDSNGNVYWISAPAAAGIHRLNKVLGTGAHTHTFYSLDSAAEGGALGFISIGNDVTSPAAVGRTVGSLRVHRRDAADPLEDDIWITAGRGNNGATVVIARQIPATLFVAGNDPGFAFFGPQFTTSATNGAWWLHLAPDGSCYVLGTGGAGSLGIQETVGRKVVSGVGDSLTIGPTQTLTDAAGLFTSGMVGKPIYIADATNAGNNGIFKVNTFVSATQITISNAAGVAETSSFNWAIPDFDSDPTTAGTGQGTWTSNTEARLSPANWFIDDTGVGYILQPRSAGTIAAHVLNHHMPLGYQWSGAVWYRAYYPTVRTGRHKVAHTAAETLAAGITAAFANGAGGPTIFVADEYYTFGAGMGLIKDATQQLDWAYDLFNEKTDLVVAEGIPSSTKTASNNTALGGFINVGSLAAVLTTSPFGLAAADALRLGHYQRRLRHNGSNNTGTLTVSGSITTVNGYQIGLDLGADTVASRVGFAQEGFTDTFWDDVQIELYSATAAAGPTSWTLRGTYTALTDNPAWNLIADAMHNSNVGTDYSTTADVGIEIEVDLDALLGGGNTAQRYWKIAVRSTGTAGASGGSLIGVVGIDATGAPIGQGGSSRRLEKSIDSNYLANEVIRAVWIQDSGTLSAARGPANNQVTLTADTFAGVLANDYFRLVQTGTGGVGADAISAPDTNGLQTLTDAGGAFFAAQANGRITITGTVSPLNSGQFIIFDAPSATTIRYFNPTGVVAAAAAAFSYMVVAQENRITIVDSATQLTCAINFASFTAQSWEVVRNVDVRPRDNEGASENQARFPSAAGEAYFCPVTGAIFYHATDVTAVRQMRAERYIKVKRSSA